MKHSDTIYALSSGAGIAGVAVVRISGARAGLLAKELCSGLPVPRVATLTAIRHPKNGELIDRGLVLWFPGPASFTGEDVVEFHVHGGLAVVRALFEAFGSYQGVRLAEAGEFTRRAYGHGKFDLMEVEGLADLIRARTEAQRRQAVYHAEGGASLVLGRWREEIIRLLSRFEAAIDFADEEHVADEALRDLGPAIQKLAQAVEAEIARGRRGERLRDGFRVVIAGAPNVGKSSLLNRLGGKDAAIVSSIPGTTRDLVEVHVTWGGLPVILQDTAGLRAGSGDVIEEEGISRTGRALEKAELVLWLTAPGAARSPAPPPTDSDVIWVWNKSDLAIPPDGHSYLAISSMTGEGIGELAREIEGRLQDFASKAEAAVIVRQRHRDALVSVSGHLRAALARPNPPLEIITEELRLAATDIGRLTGHIDVESLLDNIFHDFCIGK